MAGKQGSIRVEHTTRRKPGTKTVMEQVKAHRRVKAK